MTHLDIQPPLPSVSESFVVFVKGTISALGQIGPADVDGHRRWLFKPFPGIAIDAEQLAELVTVIGTIAEQHRQVESPMPASAM